MMQWKKPAELKYTDLCIYIDENITKIINPGENPDIENTIYNYLWLLVKALAIKKSMFQNFQDYDPYAFYAAQRLFYALRKNQTNQGKVIKGKLIRPIKSCLNYTKALLYPMKIEYQREAYREIIDEEFVSKKFDAFTFKQQLIDEVKQINLNEGLFRQDLLATIQSVDSVLNATLTKLPFAADSVEYKRIKMSILLNCLNSLKVKQRLDADLPTTIVWKLPKSIANYVKVLSKEFCAAFAKEVLDCYQQYTMDDTVAETILNYKEGSDYDFDDQY